MAHFAKVEDGIVVSCIVVKHSGEKGQAFCDKKGGTWIETSKAREFRHNYAGCGYAYSPDDDAFIPPQPYESWALDSDFMWQPPVPYPFDTSTRPDGTLIFYEWNEELGNWEELEM